LNPLRDFCPLSPIISPVSGFQPPAQIIHHSDSQHHLLLERVWGYEYKGVTKTVEVHVRWLREKIELDPSNPKRIVTVRGIGYRFEE
jgi:DNA-binding winged helix-turn-helix (wHTH) protein